MNQMDQPSIEDKSATGSSFQRFQRPAVVVGVVGLAFATLGAFLDLEQFWRSYLHAYVFWLEVGLGCLGIVMLHHLVGGRWSALIRRLMETGALTLPLMALLFLPLLLGMTTLYPWTDAEVVQQSHLLQQKSAWLNTPFFVARAALYWIVWLTLTYLLNRWSLEQDRTGEARLAKRMRRLSALGMILYVLTATFAAFDWMMSLEPEWFSSIYGLLFIIGQGIAALSLAIIGLSALAKEMGTGQAWLQSFNDLANLLLGFVLIWAYFSFSQFLVIWSANIPEEAIWYVHRSQGGWQIVGLFLIATHFVLPFFLVLSLGVKRRVRWLTVLATLIFLVRWVDLAYLLVPAFYPEGVHFHWLDLALFAAMGGAWVTLFIRRWAGRSPLPRHDPHLEERNEQHNELAPAG